MSTEDIQQKRTPYNQEAEQSCLGSIIIDNAYINEAMQKLKPEDYYFDSNRLLFKTIVELHDKGTPVDLVTLTDSLNDKKRLVKIGGVEYLNSIANIVPSAANFSYYAKIVFEKSLLRKLINASNQILSNIYTEGHQMEEIMDSSEKIIFDVTARRITQDFTRISDSIPGTIKTIEKYFERKDYITGVPTGITKLDELTAGFQRSDLIILAARPSQGKSSLAINIAEYASIKEKRNIAFFSLEMAKEQIIMRLLGSQAKVDIGAIRSGMFSDSDWPLLINAASLLHEAPIYIDDTPNIGLMELRAKARRCVTQNSIEMIIIDYLQLIHLHTRKENRQQEISEISRSLKALARELKIPIVALSQLRRMQTESAKPTLSDLRESGALEQDADVVLLLHHEKQEGEEDIPALEYQLLLEKQRNGPTGIINVRFLKKYTKFVDPSREDI